VRSRALLCEFIGDVTGVIFWVRYLGFDSGADTIRFAARFKPIVVFSRFEIT
jgi:hypothetical protein